jgi:hypothetical protein
MILQSSKYYKITDHTINRARLDNLVKSASRYKTKACGVVRHSSGKGLLPGRVIIEQKPASASSMVMTQRSLGYRKNSNTNQSSA